MSENQSRTFHVRMDADKVGVKPGLLTSMYSEIDSRARKLAGPKYEQELRISRETRDPSRYNIAVTSGMAGFLIASLQDTINNTSSMELRLHFQKLQELLMAEMFSAQEQTSNDKNPYLTFVK